MKSTKAERGDEIHRVYPLNISTWMGWLGTAVLFAATACVVYGFRTLPALNAEPKDEPVKTLILATWIVLPPGWFSIEYFLIYKKFGRPDSFEAFKYGQEIAAKFWVAVSTLLSALYVGPNLLKSLAEHSGKH